VGGKRGYLNANLQIADIKKQNSGVRIQKVRINICDVGSGLETENCWYKKI